MTAPEWGKEPHGTTPLDPDEFDGLIPTDVATRADLNAVERNNILAARVWAFTSGALTLTTLLTISTVDLIHRRMFSDVWRWAGKHRQRSTNIGVEPAQILTRLKDLLDDAQFWHDNETYSPIEIAVRLHHQLVQVHPYVNGNGRHARFVADLYLHLRNQPALSWKPDESEATVSRNAYIAALRLADAGDYSSLIAYASG